MKTISRRQKRHYDLHYDWVPATIFESTLLKPHRLTFEEKIQKAQCVLNNAKGRQRTKHGGLHANTYSVRKTGTSDVDASSASNVT
jgi:hypothetical protein